MLDNFLDEVIGFQKDRSQEVRKFLVGFIEESCKKDAEILPKVITNLQIFLLDEGLAIKKRVIQVRQLTLLNARQFLIYALIMLISQKRPF